jgi:hypothetical protein
VLAIFFAVEELDRFGQRLPEIDRPGRKLVAQFTERSIQLAA